MKLRKSLSVRLMKNCAVAEWGSGWGYAVFGKVVNGMDVVDDIAKTPTGNKGMHQDVPKETISIDKGERLPAT